jgi:sugar O-acyltransferase (sialic acid O-acetyltransferase NeuD family)
VTAATLGQRLVIIGAGGHAKVAADIARLSGLLIEGFLDDVAPGRKGEPFCGAAVLGGTEMLADLKVRGVATAFVAVGDNVARLRLAGVVRERGLRMARLIHPAAIVAAGAVVGEGVLVAAGAVVNPDARVEACAIVNTSASVDHDCVIDEGAHVGPGVRLGGTARVGRGAWVGIGASVNDGVSIGAGSVIGAGAVVLRDVPAGVVAYGVPARVMRAVSDV